MDQEYGARYRRLYEQHWWWRARERYILKRLHELDIPQGGSVLDIGCGDGLFFSRLADFGRVEGVEADAALVGNGSHASRIHVGMFDRGFQPDRQYALIVMLDVLEHLDQPQEALQHAVELLQPGGTLLITVPAFRMLWTAHDEFNHHRTRYTKRTLDELARYSGICWDCRQYFFHCLFPLKLAMRMKEQLVSRAPRPADVPSRPLNWLMENICRIEQRVAGDGLPFGTSLMATYTRPHAQYHAVTNEIGARDVVLVGK